MSKKIAFAALLASVGFLAACQQPPAPAPAPVVVAPEPVFQGKYGRT